MRLLNHDTPVYYRCENDSYHDIAVSVALFTNEKIQPPEPELRGPRGKSPHPIFQKSVIHNPHFWYRKCGNTPLSHLFQTLQRYQNNALFHSLYFPLKFRVLSIGTKLGFVGLVCPSVRSIVAQS